MSLLADLFPDSPHVRLLGSGGAAVIWQLARDHGCLLVTKDEDFHRLSVLRGPAEGGRVQMSAAAADT